MKRDLEGRLESQRETSSPPSQQSHQLTSQPEHFPSLLDCALYKLVHWMQRNGATNQPLSVVDAGSADARITNGLTAQLAREIGPEFDPVWYAMQQADSRGAAAIASYFDYLDIQREQQKQSRNPSFLGTVARYAALAAPVVGVAAVIAASLFHSTPAHATPDSLDSLMMASHVALGVPVGEDMALSDSDIADDWGATVDHVKQAKTYHQLLHIYTSQITSRGAKYSGIRTIGTNQYFAFTLTPPDDPTTQDRIRSVNYAFYNLMQDFNLSQDAMQRIIATYLEVNFDLYVPVKDIGVHVTSDRVDFSYIGTDERVLREGPFMNKRKTKWSKGRPPNAALWSPKEEYNTIYVDVNDLMPAYPTTMFKEEADKAARESRKREAALSQSLEFNKGVLILSAITPGNEERQGYTPTNNLFTVELPLPENTTLVGRVDNESNLVPLINGVPENAALPVDLESTLLQPVTVTYTYTGPKPLSERDRLQIESAITTQYFLQFTKRPEQAEPELPEPPVAEPLPVSRTVAVNDFPGTLYFYASPDITSALNTFTVVNAERSPSVWQPNSADGELDSYNYTATLPENAQQLLIVTGNPEGTDMDMKLTRERVVTRTGVAAGMHGGVSTEIEMYNDADPRPQSFIGNQFHPGDKFMVRVSSDDNYRMYQVTLVQGDAIEAGEEGLPEEQPQAISIAGDLPDKFDVHGLSSDHNEAYHPEFIGLVSRDDRYPINWTVETGVESLGSNPSDDTLQLRLEETSLIGKITASTDLGQLFLNDPAFQHQLLLRAGLGYHATTSHERGLLDSDNIETGDGDGLSWTAGLQWNTYTADAMYKLLFTIASVQNSLAAQQNLSGGRTPVNGSVPDSYQRNVEENPWNLDLKLHLLGQSMSGNYHSEAYVGIVDIGNRSTTTLSPVVNGATGNPDLTTSSYRRLTTPYGGISGTYNFTEWLGLGVGFEGRYTIASSERVGNVPNDTQLEALIPLEAQLNLAGEVRLIGRTAFSTQDLARTNLAGNVCFGGGDNFHDTLCLGVSTPVNSHSLGPEYDGINVTFTYEEN